MIGDDDFFMQNADYHYGASDVEKMYGRNYDGSSDYVPGYRTGGYGGSGSSDMKDSSANDGSGKFCIAGVLIVLVILLLPTVIVPAVTDAMSSSVSIDELKITRYIHTTQYNSELSTAKGYEIDLKQWSYGTHAINVIFYSKKGEILYNGSNYVGTPLLEDGPYIIYLDEKADYADFEVYRTHLTSGKCIYRERVDVDNVNVIKEFTDYDNKYN